MRAKLQQFYERIITMMCISNLTHLNNHLHRAVHSCVFFKILVVQILWRHLVTALLLSHRTVSIFLEIHHVSDFNGRNKVTFYK
ncbi:MAG: hypothetical protein JWQ40_3254 [Segetibacter sp.]|nr:hypothetical protein [Segetibacter sp.]